MNHSLKWNTFHFLDNPEVIDAKAGFIDPYLLGVYVNEPTSIHCKSTTKVRWTKKFGQLPETAIIVENDLCIEKTQLEDSGLYQCIGTTDSGLVYSTVSKVLVGRK